MVCFKNEGSSSSSKGAISGAAGRRGEVALGMQTAVAQQVFWLLFVIAANNRPSAKQVTAARGLHPSYGQAGRVPVPVEIQQLFVSTLHKLASHKSTAFCLLPQKVQVAIQRALLAASRGTLQFETIAADLLSTASSCAMPGLHSTAAALRARLRTLPAA